MMSTDFTRKHENTKKNFFRFVVSWFRDFVMKTRG